MNYGMPHKESVDAKKVAAHVFEKIFPAMHGVDLNEMVLSLICAAAIAMKPNVNRVQLQNAVMETSGHLIAQLADPIEAEDGN